MVVFAIWAAGTTDTEEYTGEGIKVGVCSVWLGMLAGEGEEVDVGYVLSKHFGQSMLSCMREKERTNQGIWC